MTKSKKIWFWFDSDLDLEVESKSNAKLMAKLKKIYFEEI